LVNLVIMAHPLRMLRSINVVQQKIFSSTKYSTQGKTIELL